MFSHHDDDIHLMIWAPWDGLSHPLDALSCSGDRGTSGVWLPAANPEGQVVSPGSLHHRPASCKHGQSRKEGHTCNCKAGTDCFVHAETSTNTGQGMVL